MPGRPFPKGTSGNPRGRPPGFAAEIRKRSNEGKAFIDYAFKIFEDPNEDEDRRWDALLYLTDRGFGKPTQSVDVEANQTVNVILGDL